MYYDAAARQQRHLYPLTVWNNIAQRLIFDQSIAQFKDSDFEFVRYVVDADVGSAKLAHAASVEPFQRTLVFFGHENHCVMTWGSSSRFEDMLFPFRGRPPAKHVWIVDSASAMFIEIRNQPHGIAEVIECRGVSRCSTYDDAVLAAFNNCRQLWVI